MLHRSSLLLRRISFPRRSKYFSSEKINSIYSKISAFDRSLDEVTNDDLKPNILTLIEFTKAEALSTELSGESLAKILGCMQNSLHKDDGVEELVQNVYLLLSKNNDKFTDVEIEHSFTGIRFLNFGIEGFPELLELLHKKMSTAGKLSLRSLTFAYNGLQSLESTESEVKAILRELNKRLHSTKDSFQSDDFARIFLGMQNMSSREDEVRDLLVELVRRVKECRLNLFAAEENAMFGMFHMNRKDPIVKSLLAELKKKECDVDGNAFL